MKIHEYASKGDLVGIRAEIDRGESIEAFDEHGVTPLMRAVQSHHTTPEFLKSLIELGANVNGLARAREERRFTENEIARFQEMGLDVSIFLEEPKPRSIDSVLVYAMTYASQTKIEALLQAGADATFVDPCGYGLINRVTGRRFPESIAERYKLVSRLIEAGAPLNAESAYGETALSRASNGGDYGLVRLLLESGADPAPLEWDDLCQAVIFDDLSRVKSLVATGASPEARERWGRTPFLLAVRMGTIEIASILLSYGCDPSARNRSGETALMHAIERDDATMLSWLIEEGADVEEADDQGNTPLIRAAQQGATLCARALLASGADVGRRNQYGKSAIGEAANPEIVEMLEQRGECLDELDEGMRRVLAGHEG